MATVKVQFEGGLQIDFDAPNGLALTLPAGTTLGQLPGIVASQFINPLRPIRFVNQAGAVVPGVLIMLNDVDSEVEGLDTVLSSGDVITFISTLHGG